MVLLCYVETVIADHRLCVIDRSEFRLIKLQMDYTEKEQGTRDTLLYLLPELAASYQGGVVEVVADTG